MGLRVRFLSICLFSLILTTSAGVGAAEQLAGSEWRPTQIGELEVPSDAEIFVRFGAADRLEGYGGCNHFFGSFKLSGEGIEIGPLGATRMLCATDELMAREDLFLEALQNAKRFDRDRIELILSDAEGNPLVQLQQTDPD